MRKHGAFLVIAAIRRLLVAEPMTAPTPERLDELATALQRVAPRWLSALVRWDGARLVVDYHDGSSWRVLAQEAPPPVVIRRVRGWKTRRAPKQRQDRLDLLRERAQLRRKG